MDLNKSQLKTFHEYYPLISLIPESESISLAERERLTSTVNATKLLHLIGKHNLNQAQDIQEAGYGT